MAEDFSFDVVSKVDMNAAADAVNSAGKEIANRFDFRGTNSTLELDQKASEIRLASSDEFKIKSLSEVLFTRLSKRGVPLKNIEAGKIESSLGGAAKQTLKIKQGIPVEKAREMVKLIKAGGLKVTASIQAEQVRVVSRSKDSLQSAMALLRGNDFGLDVQFTNYR